MRTLSLKKRDADVSAKNKSGETALISAAVFGHTKIVEILLSKGVDVNAKDEGGKTALMSAVIGEHIETVEMLLIKGTEVNTKNEEGETALMSTVLRRDEIVRLLKQAGAKEGELE